ncbi:MAG: sucrose phosphorylase [Pseudomonadales bacterium]|nr:sucrose phosphorylase [Pseudomonadales bacterium]MCK5789438.1 sucrose phosphorylase [Ketobacter sp.]MEC8812301.1 sucrose phosphorylase [Pseudomonadota bacterium]HAG93283.1 sucrose phosphorylase [Gammaproteobacteria bacterium]MBI25505.1 sucrose phosphorylase [Pseudomonadales bacterium]|tara:strand:- start:3381 stop:4823 length:1443 start_codon:yes stop_codon:yes gene_type:complete
MPLRNAVQLICYPDRLGNNLRDLNTVIEKHLHDAIGGVHILPFYPSNADGGFSPLTHEEVDPAFGTWEDIERISSRYDLCADLTVNHISDESVEFRDFVAKGFDSEYADLFVDVEKFGEITPDDMAKIHIRKEKEPFREVEFANGGRASVWCTFTEHQIDLNYESEKTYQLMERYIRFLTEKGVTLFRLDAFGYTTKKIGTSCFLVEPNVYRILEWVNEVAQRHGAECLPEVHDHTSYQYAISRRNMHPYGFALPPLLLYSLLDANSVYLKNWLRMCPRNMITVLDTHDGICIPDVEGVLPDDKIKDLIDNIDARSADPILRRSAANIHSVGAIYQLTCTFYDAMMQNDDAYIAARAIQFFAPGIPQVYYVGLLAGVNDRDLMERTGELRDINRKYYTLEEVDEAVEQPVVQRLLRLMRFRSNYPAFQGRFELNYSNDSSVAMAWRHGEHYCHLFVDLNFNTSTITYIDEQDGSEQTFHG